MLKSRKHVFWEALFVTLIIFITGLLLGIWIESLRISTINEYFAESEILLMDTIALNNLFDMEKINCSRMIKLNIKFADRIYEEARQLEQYEGSERLSEGLKIAHKRYDLMRTLLWINTFELETLCSENPITVVYLYELETEDLAQKATQNVWSRILSDLKEKKGNEILLIPIATDRGISSLNSLIENYEINSSPVVIIENEIVLEKLTSVEELEKYFN
ncbi:hypothetical protein K9L16_02285 [Candidatus Pacearchaeota archaeon]|nr:hypothetical protein [Candidatus Pacearchaeota archaeon]